MTVAARWRKLDDPGQDLVTVRAIRDDIRGRVEKLLDELAHPTPNI